MLAIVAVGCAREQRFQVRNLPADLRYPDIAPRPQQSLNRLAGPSHDTLSTGDPLLFSLNTGVSSLDIAGQALRVDDTGGVAVPHVGRVRVAGLSPADAEREVGLAMQGARLPAARVTLVRAPQTRQVTVLGGVKQPGVYRLDSQRSDILSAVVSAGGLADNAGDFIEVCRPGGESKRSEPGIAKREPGVVLASHQTPIEPAANNSGAKPTRISLNASEPIVPADRQLDDGSVVIVDEQPRPAIMVLGQVGKPGRFELPADRPLHILEAIALAHGASNQVVDTIVVCRKRPGEKKAVVIEVSLRGATRDQEEDLILAPGDVVSVEATPRTLIVDSAKYVSFAAAGLIGLPRFFR